MWDYIGSAAWVSLAGTFIYFSVSIVGKHKGWMIKVNDAIRFKEEAATQWYPRIEKSERSIAVIEAKLDLLIKGQERIEKILDRRSGWRISNDGERNSR
jgi:hypothetical protein